ncbi:MAG: TSUP family transporter [Succinivibrio sp.]|nr:TSUP family transporter [Succinivibrio sp.]
MSDFVGIITEQLLLLFFSGLASLLASVSGGGGGLILLPVLVLLGLPYMVALGTHKSGMLLISLGNLVRRRGTGSLNREISLVLLLLGVPGVVAGTYLVSLVPEQVARMILGALSVGMAIYSYCSKKLTAEHSGNPPTTAMRATGALFTFPLKCGGQNRS